MMLNQHTSDEDTFGTRPLKEKTRLEGDRTALNPPDLRQWLEYWNDADSIAGNLRKVEHWLQRARQQQSA